jgi:acetylornithine deacetylase/succinyl-diaminopimelate desuccinylase-like protein
MWHGGTICSHHIGLAHRTATHHLQYVRTNLYAPSTTGEVHRALARSRERLRARDARILRTQVEIAQIAAPTGEEEERGAWVAAYLERLGYVIERDAAGNVIGRRPRARRHAPVVVCAHLDTVFPHGTALDVHREGDRFVGPGIGDNGRGLAVMLALAEEFDSTRVRTARPVDVVATTGEEGAGDLRGAKELFANCADAFAVIALDGAGDERIVHRALGSRRFRISYFGPGGHSWSAYGVPNPVNAAGFAVARLARLTRPHVPRTTLTVSRVGGGLSVNSIPDEGWLEIDLRCTSSATLDRIEYDIRLIAQAALDEENARRTAATPPLTHHIDTIGNRPCGEVPADHPLITAAQEATRLVGRDPELVTASTDANIPISRGIPAIAIGAGGRGGETHTPGEWYDNVDGALGVARAMTIIADAAGMAV